MQETTTRAAVAFVLMSCLMSTSCSIITYVASVRFFMQLEAAEVAKAEQVVAADEWSAAPPDVDDDQAAESPAMPPTAEASPEAGAPEMSYVMPPTTAALSPLPLKQQPGGGASSISVPEPIIKALPDFLPLKLPPFPWWALPIPSKSSPWSDPAAGLPHFPILDNLFLLLKIADSCFNCTYFLSVDTPLLLSPNGRPLDLSPANLRLLYYQVVPFRLPFAALEPLPLAFRIPSFLNGSYLLVTRSTSSFPRDNFASLNYQRLLAPDLFISDSMVVHGISGFLAPFTLAISFP